MFPKSDKKPVLRHQDTYLSLFDKLKEIMGYSGFIYVKFITVFVHIIENLRSKKNSLISLFESRL